MKKILPLVISLFVMGSLFGQAMTFDADPVVKEGTIEDFLVDGKFTATNSSSETINFVWELIRTDIPDEWKFTICDTRLCFSPGFESCIDAGCETNTMGAGESTSAMKVSLQPNGVKYDGIVHLRLVDVNDTSIEIGILELQFNIQGSTATEDVVSEKVNVFPNPTSDYFKIESSNDYSQVVVYNIIGKEMSSFNFAPAASYDIRDLQSGLYLVRLLDNTGESQKVMRLTKK